MYVQGMEPWGAEAQIFIREQTQVISTVKSQLSGYLSYFCTCACTFHSSFWTAEHSAGADFTIFLFIIALQINIFLNMQDMQDTFKFFFTIDA